MYGVIPSFEIRCRDVEIIGIDYSTQQSRNKDRQIMVQKKKMELFLTTPWSHTEVGKIYSGLWKITFSSKKHFLLYNCVTEVQQYHFVPVTGMLFIIFYWLEFYLFLLIQTLSTAKSLQWRGERKMLLQVILQEVEQVTLRQISDAQCPKKGMVFWTTQERVGQDKLLYMLSNFNSIFTITTYSRRSPRGFVPLH